MTDIVYNVPWPRVQEEVQKKLDERIRHCIETGISEARTNQVRGEIKALKWVLDIPRREEISRKMLDGSGGVRIP